MKDYKVEQYNMVDSVVSIVTLVIKKKEKEKEEILLSQKSYNYSNFFAILPIP